MNLWYVWLIAYAAPILLARTWIYFSFEKTEKPNPRGIAVMQAALIVLIILSQAFIRNSGHTFPWFPGVGYILFYLASVLASSFIASGIGFGYSISTLIQQLTLQSINFLLLTKFSVYLAMLLVVPIYVLGHRMEPGHRFLKLGLILLWGLASVYIFSIFPNVYLIAGLQAIFGSILISTSLIRI